MKHHGDKIQQTKLCKKDLKRAEWATFFNVQKMYELVYEEIYRSGVAIKSNCNVIYDKEGCKLLADDKLSTDDTLLT
ncbi:MAG: hypothetical protein MUC61_01400, partial [Amoebophilaceae bacterium]|nr:hypothetical protein [Amoebophilaceae bacterium]